MGKRFSVRNAAHVVRKSMVPLEIPPWHLLKPFKNGMVPFKLTARHHGSLLVYVTMYKCINDYTNRYKYTRVII